LALGGFSYGVSPMMMVGAYNCFASGGAYYEPRLIQKIENAKGELLYQYTPKAQQVMSKENASILNSLLGSVVREGTGKRLGEIAIPLSGKTGTVGVETGNRDAWMAAYNPEYTAVVWMGYDTALEGVLPEEATGGRYPAQLLSTVFTWLYREKEAPVFTESALCWQ